MAGEDRAVLIMLSQSLHGKKSPLGESGIDASTGMPFGKYEAIAIRPTRISGIDTEYFSVKQCNDIGRRQA